jgi:hypothetical protein
LRRLAALAAVAAGGVLLLAGCGSEETVTVTATVAETEATTVSETVVETETSAVASGALPEPVEEKRADIAAAAESGDYEALRPLIAEQFSYSFGGPFEGGPIGFWRFLEREQGVRPIEILADLMQLPYTLYQGIYTWPFAFDKAQTELTAYERGLLKDVGGVDLSDDFFPDPNGGYYGWRAGIEPDGDWIFFIAGD